jgi:hypothetical protein
LPDGNHYLDAKISVINTVRGEPFGFAQDRLVEPSFLGMTLRQAEGERVILTAISKTMD